MGIGIEKVNYTYVDQTIKINVPRFNVNCKLVGFLLK